MIHSCCLNKHALCAMRCVRQTIAIALFVLVGACSWFADDVLPRPDVGTISALETAAPVSVASENDEQLILVPTQFTALEGWFSDRQDGALFAYLRSCERFDAQPADRPLGGAGIVGTIGDFHPSCAAARQVPVNDAAAARRFFELWFQPFRLVSQGRSEGLFTGYFEPELEGCPTPLPNCDVPLYRRPANLVEVELGRFRADLDGRRVAGLVEDGKLQPFPDRAMIDAGALAGRGLELLYLRDPVDAFFLHVQGSGRVRFPDGRVVQVGYAGQNGHVYRSIGRELVRRGVMTVDQASAQSIKAWVQANPAQAASLLAVNPSYIFFAERHGPGPIGAQGVALTPGRSIAVDRRFLPLGVPLWVDLPFAGARDDYIRQLTIAQDTGGAIRGPIRGDFFWGTGEGAGALAGRMKSRGSAVVLLPRTIAARMASAY